MDLNQITIPSLNLEKSVKFYKVLGGHLIVDALPRYARFECPEGTSTFSIHKVEKLAKEPGTVIYFESDNLDKWVNGLQKKGLKFNLLPRDQDWLWREARLQDPDGNHIILYSAGKNRKNPPWKLV